MAYNYTGAINAGANPSDVGNYLAKQTGYNFNGAVSAGANINDVLKYMSTLPNKTITPTPISLAQPQGFMANVNADTNTRAQTVATAIEKPAQEAEAGASPLTVGKDVAEAGLTTAGQVAGSIGDFITEGVKAITPQPILDALSSVAQKVGGTSAVQTVAQKWNDFATVHPEAAQNLGSIFNIGSLTVGGEGASVAEKPLTEVSGAIGDTATTLSDNAATQSTARIAENSSKDALEVVKPKLTPTEESAAKAAGRGKTTGILKTTSIAPTAKEVEMATYAQDAGVKSSNSFDQNIKLMKDAQTQSAQKLRAGLQDSKATWNQNDVKSVLSKVEKPLTIKSDTTLSKLATNFQKATLDIAKNTPKNAEGILDMRQSLDTLIDKEFPASIYTKDTPIGQYVRSTRQALNDFAESKLPEGKLPDGSTFKGELRKQSLLYDAIDNVSEKAPKSGTNIVHRAAQAIKEHPVVTTVGAAAAGYEAAKHLGL